MPCVFKSCPFETNSNGGFKQEHVESCSSTTKNIVSPLPQCVWPPNLAGWLVIMRGSSPQSHMTLWSRGRAASRDRLKHISTATVPMATKLGRMVTYRDWLLPIKSHGTLINWSWKITWQTKIIISPLLQFLWPLNLGEWWLTLRGFNP